MPSTDVWGKDKIQCLSSSIRKNILSFAYGFRWLWERNGLEFRMHGYTDFRVCRGLMFQGFP
jgi:hypothetical protein